MRNIINISLPKEMAMKVKREIRSGNYATTSEFFRDLFRQWEEKKLLSELRESQEEIRTGKAKKLNSLKDLR